MIQLGEAERVEVPNSNIQLPDKLQNPSSKQSGNFIFRLCGAPRLYTNWHELAQRGVAATTRETLQRREKKFTEDNKGERKKRETDGEVEEKRFLQEVFINRGAVCAAITGANSLQKNKDLQDCSTDRHRFFKKGEEGIVMQGKWIICLAGEEEEEADEEEDSSSVGKRRKVHGDSVCARA